MKTLKPEFVEYVPKDIDEGILYISIRFKTAVHKCACGCGIKTVTRFSPTDWEFTFDGKTVSLSPSIGNWSFPCESHYWIKKNKIIWDNYWTARKIKMNRRYDRLIKFFSSW